ncbi:MAG: branched-chain amino acid ABC transporter permease [Alphaproteobacteria bacterium]|nr:branched-chain amino acid ABC transporter permease [Alphaproteobacteria bacterium]
MNTVFILNVLSDALAYGMLLFTISIGLSIMMGLMRVINLAHGAFAMLGGYIASYAMSGRAVRVGTGSYVFSLPALNLPYAVAIALAVAGTVIVALPFERLLFRRIYRNADPLAQVLMTIGICFFLIGLANLVFGPTLSAIPLPMMLRGPLDLGFRVMPTHRVFVILCGAVTALALWFLVEKTEFGIRLRAAVDNSAMADALGIRTQIIYAATFALAIALAAFGGVVGAEILPIEPFYGQRYMVVFLVVVSVGGAGSIAGALSASLLLGLADTLGRYVPGDYGEFFFYLAVVGIVVAFPQGLLARVRQA